MSGFEYEVREQFTCCHGAPTKWTRHSVLEIMENMYWLSAPSSWHRHSEPSSLPGWEELSFVLMRWLGGSWTGAGPSKDYAMNRSLEFSGSVSPILLRGDEMEVMAKHPYVTQVFIKPQKHGVGRASGLVDTRRCGRLVPREGTDAPHPSPRTCPTHLFHLDVLLFPFIINW